MEILNSPDCLFLEWVVGGSYLQLSIAEYMYVVLHFFLLYAILIHEPSFIIDHVEFQRGFILGSIHFLPTLAHIWVGDGCGERM